MQKDDRMHVIRHDNEFIQLDLRPDLLGPDPLVSDSLPDLVYVHAVISNKTK